AEDGIRDFHVTGVQTCALPIYRAKVKEIIEYTARHFDEVILDDFFFTSCKSTAEFKAKGDRSWSEYRFELMTEAAKNLIMKSAKIGRASGRERVEWTVWVYTVQ